MKPNRPTLAVLALLTGLGSGPAFPVILIGSGSLLTACSTSNAPQVSQAIADAQSIVQGVKGSYAALKMLYPDLLSPAADAQVQSLLASAPDILSRLSETADAATNAGGLRGIESIVNGVLNIAASALAKVPAISPNVLLGLQAATVLLPFLEATANTLVPEAPKVGAPPARFRSSMTVGDARKALAR